MDVMDAQMRFAAQDITFQGFMYHQLKAFEMWDDNSTYPVEARKPLDKMLVFYPTGKGKSKIMLTMMALRDAKTVVVIAPPVTHQAWIKDGEALGILVLPMSHAKFRQAETKMSRTIPVIVDEFHLLGGHTGKGWKKLDRMATGMQAPLVLGSATPNYNDAERCYCLVHVLSPHDNKGGYLAWLYEHCVTAANPFGTTPLVQGFYGYKSAAEFLEHQPKVIYLPDDAPDILRDIPVDVELPDEFLEYGLDRPKHRIVASSMENRHRKRFYQIIDPKTDRVREEIYSMLADMTGNAITPILIFCARKQIAFRLAEDFKEMDVQFGYVDGDTPGKVKDAEMATFKQGLYDVLVGTATLATGADGLDKMCDTLVILDDTDDDSLRRQLVGRILPRGDVKPEDYDAKVAYRFVYGD
jgi:hypothetical protein